jgi:hypothetical protein
MLHDHPVADYSASFSPKNPPPGRQSADKLNVKLFFCAVWLLPAGEILAQTQERVVESIVPWLVYNSDCSSAVELQNLGDRESPAEVEAHKSSGALVPLVGHSGNSMRLSAGEHAEYRLQIAGETDGAWVLIREKIPSSQRAPVLAVSGVTECAAGEKLNSTVREVAWPIRNPGYSSDVKHGDDGIIALINASERPVSVWGCYSSGSLYSVPRNDRQSELMPLCSDRINEWVPPYGTRQFPVTRGGNSHFSLSTRGDAIVLQMLRPAATGAKAYKVDSTITFGEEVPGR